MSRREIAPTDDDIERVWRIRTGALFFVGPVLLVVVAACSSGVFLEEVAPWIVRLLGVGGDASRVQFA